MKGDIGSYILTWMRSPFMRMGEIFRYSSWPVNHRESVAEHCWYVCFFSMLLADFLVSNGYDVEEDKLLRRAVVHDLDEALTGDFIRTFKHSDPELKRVLGEHTKAGMVDTLRGLPGGFQLYLTWEQGKDRSLEGQILALADLWSVVYYARRETLLGNNYARAVAEEVGVWLNQSATEAYPNPVLRECAERLGDLARVCADDPHAVREAGRRDLADPFFWSRIKGEQQ